MLSGYLQRLGATVVIVALSTAPTPARADIAYEAARSYQANARHTGYSPVTVEAPLRRLWHRKDLGSAVSYPIVVGNRVYAIVSDSRNGRNFRARLMAFSARRGRTVWSQLITEGTSWASLAYSSGRLFVAERLGGLTAFDARSGGRLWERDLERMTDQHQFTSIPVATKRRVFIGGAGEGARAFAVSARRGRLIWKSRKFDPSGAGHIGVTRKRVIVGLSGSAAVVLRRSDGKHLWSHRPYNGGASGVTPVHHRGHLYLRDDSHAGGVVVDVSTRRRVGDFDSRFPPALRRRKGLFVIGGELVARRLPDARKLWRFQGDGRLTLAPVIARRHAYVVSRRGKVYGVDVRDGRRLWRHDLGKGIFFYHGTMECCSSNPPVGLGVGEDLLVVPAYSRDSTQNTVGHLFVFASRR